MKKSLLLRTILTIVVMIISIETVCANELTITSGIQTFSDTYYTLSSYGCVVYLRDNTSSHPGLCLRADYSIPRNNIVFGLYGDVGYEIGGERPWAYASTGAGTKYPYPILDTLDIVVGGSLGLRYVSDGVYNFSGPPLVVDVDAIAGIEISSEDRCCRMDIVGLYRPGYFINYDSAFHLIGGRGNLVYLVSNNFGIVSTIEFTHNLGGDASYEVGNNIAILFGPHFGW